MSDQDSSDTQSGPTDIFGVPMEPLPAPIGSTRESPDQILDMIKNGKIAQTREEFMGLPPKGDAPAAPAAPAADVPLAPAPQAIESHPSPPAAPPVPPAVPPADHQSQSNALEPERNFPVGASSKRRDSDDLIIPKVPVTNADIDRFLTCVKDGTYYSETFIKGGFKATFRVKSALEIAWLRACLSRMVYVTEELKTRADMDQAVLRFNLLFQVTSAGGRTFTGVTVPSVPPWKDEDLNLEEIFWKSEFSKMSEITLFMIQTMMVQFETKIRDIEMAVIDPKFLSEDPHS